MELWEYRVAALEQLCMRLQKRIESLEQHAREGRPRRVPAELPTKVSNDHEAPDASMVSRQVLNTLATREGQATMRQISAAVPRRPGDADAAHMNRVHCSTVYMRRGGFIEAPARRGGLYTLTDKGWSALAMKPPVRDPVFASVEQETAPRVLDALKMYPTTTLGGPEP